MVYADFPNMFLSRAVPSAVKQPDTSSAFFVWLRLQTPRRLLPAKMHFEIAIPAPFRFFSRLDFAGVYKSRCETAQLLVSHRKDTESNTQEESRTELQ